MDSNNKKMEKFPFTLEPKVELNLVQPRSQGLSSSRPRKRERGDPGWGWSRVSQNLGDYK